METLSAFLNYLDALGPVSAFFIMSILIIWMGIIVLLLSWAWHHMRPAKKLPPFIIDEVGDDQLGIDEYLK